MLHRAGYNVLHEQLERFGYISRQNVQITTGVAWATFPTSSSACMMRLMRAIGNLLVTLRFTIVDRRGASAPRFDD